MDNHGGSDLTDGPTSPVADPPQVRNDLFWDLKVNARREVLRVESKATNIFAFINHGLAPKTNGGWQSPLRRRGARWQARAKESFISTALTEIQGGRSVNRAKVA
jgi:hypothetical protein